jgi:DNA-binding LacI/PurR family transcriptional regulator
VLGLIGNALHVPAGNALFLEGMREEAGAAGFRVAELGSAGLVSRDDAPFEMIADMNLAGLAINLSTADAMHIEGDPLLAERIRGLPLPLVLSRPLPAVTADSVTSDEFQAFRRMGEALTEQDCQAIHFLGHQGLPSLARLYGLEAGIGPDITLTSEILDRERKHLLTAVTKCLRAKSRKMDALVIGAPPAAQKDLEAIAVQLQARKPIPRLAIVLEEGMGLPTGLTAMAAVRPSRRLGAMTAQLLIRRLTHPRTDLRHQVIPHPILP